MGDLYRARGVADVANAQSSRGALKGTQKGGEKGCRMILQQLLFTPADLLMRLGSETSTGPNLGSCSWSVQI